MAPLENRAIQYDIFEANQQLWYLELVWGGIGGGPGSLNEGGGNTNCW